MKHLIILFCLLSQLCLAQSSVKNLAKKLGPDPLYFIDSVKISKDDLKNLDAKTICSLTVLTDTDATNKFGPNARDGVVLLVTKAQAKRNYIRFFRRKSTHYDSLMNKMKSDSTFQYIINDKIKIDGNNSEGDLAAINDDLFISLEILSADDLKNKYSIIDKSVGVLIRCRKPKNFSHVDERF